MQQERHRLFEGLLILFVLLQMPGAVYAEFNYTVNNGSVTITDYTGTESEVVLPSSINEMPVTAIGYRAFYQKTNVTSITLQNSVKDIGPLAFARCSSLTSFAIPQSVTNIGADAFILCSALTAVDVDDLNPAYSSIDGVLFSKSVDALIRYPQAKAGGYSIPTSVVTIRASAFRDCPALASISIPESVRDIQFLAFANCKMLTSITIPASVTNLGADVFDGNTNLQAINVDDLNTTYSSIDGVVFSGTGGILLQCPPGKAGNYEMPDIASSVASSAFKGCRQLTSITIPNSVTNIGAFAFHLCGSLTNLTLPDYLTTIEDGTFHSCSNLTSLTIPSGVVSIGAAFIRCAALTNIFLPDGLTHIASSTFLSCSNLTSVHLPETVVSIGDFAFSSCRSLTNVVIPASVTNIGSQIFTDCSSLTEIKVDPLNEQYSVVDGVLFTKSLNTIVEYPEGRRGGYVIPDTVTHVGSAAFGHCGNLTSIVMSDSITSIGDSAFWGCTSLTNVSIPSSVTDIGHWAFHDCANLTRVYCGGAAPTLGAGVFYGATNTTVHFLPATTGWATTFGERPTALWVPIMPLPSAPGDYLLKLVTHSPAPTTVRVQRSMDLLHWEDWQTVSRDQGPSELQDPDAGTTPYRFYRGIEFVRGRFAGVGD